MKALVRKAYRRLRYGGLIEDMKSRGLVTGENLKVLQGVTIDWSHCQHITIGDDVTLAPGVRIIAHDASTMRHLGYARIGKIDIGDRVFIGAGSIVLPGVCIGPDVVIGAGSVVSRDIPSRMVACGNPARVIAPLDEWIERKKAEMDIVPLFGEEYTVRQNVSAAMRAEMNERMERRIGYIR